MTLQQFIDIDLEAEADPPRYTTNRIKEARAQAIQDGNVALLTSGKLDDPREVGKRAKAWRTQLSLTQRQKELNNLYDQLANDMGEDDGEENVSVEANTTNTPQIHTPHELAAWNPDVNGANAPNPSNHGTQQAFKYPKGNNGRLLVLPNEATVEELEKSYTPEVSELNLEEWKHDMPLSAMDEINSLFRDDEEVKQKEAIFNKMNKEYIEKQLRLENERLAAEKIERDNEDMDAMQFEEQARYINSRKSSQIIGRRSGVGRRVAVPTGSGVTENENNVGFDDDDQEEGGPTTEEALMAAISSRKISRKINYDAMSTIFDDAGTFSTEMLEDNEPEKSYDDAWM